MWHNWIQAWLRNIPGAVGIVLRRAYYRRRFRSCGRRLVISEGVFIDHPENMEVGSYVWIDKGVIIVTGVVQRPHKKVAQKVPYEGQLILGSYVHLGIRSIIQAHGGVKTGDYFTLGSDSKIYSLSNDVSLSRKGTFGPSSEDLHYIQNAIEIGDNVWCGMNAIILNGPIGDNVFIKPNCICYEPLESNAVVEGSPAKKIKPRF